MIRSPWDLPREVRELVPRLKKDHDVLYVVELQNDTGEVYAIFRPMRKEEVRYLEENAPYHDEWWMEGWIIGHTLVWPDPHVLDEWLAGTVESLGDSIIEASGWSSVEATVEGIHLARQEATSLDSAILAFICKAFPSIHPRDLQKMTLLETQIMLARAEMILGQPLDLQMFLDPEGYQKRLKRQQRFQPPAMLPDDPGAFDTPPEAMQRPRRPTRPHHSYLPDTPMDEKEMLSPDAATKLRSGDSLRDEMAAHQDFLG